MLEIPAQAIRVLGYVLLLGPPIAYYVYRDASRHDEDHPILLAVATGLLGIPGLFFYLYRRGRIAPDSE